VLQKNALGETSYRYFRDDAGVYTVFLKVWVGDRYQAASNVESYKID